MLCVDWLPWFCFAEALAFVVVSAAVPLLDVLLGIFETPNNARKTVKVAMMPAFCFMTMPYGELSVAAFGCSSS